MPYLLEEEKMRALLVQWVERYEHFARYMLNLYLIGAIFVWVSAGWTFGIWALLTAILYTLSAWFWVLPIWQLVKALRIDRDERICETIDTQVAALRSRRAIFGEVEHFLFIREGLRFILPAPLHNAALEQSGLPIRMVVCKRSGLVLAWQLIAEK